MLVVSSCVEGIKETLTKSKYCSQPNDDAIADSLAQSVWRVYFGSCITTSRHFGWCLEGLI